MRREVENFSPYSLISIRMRESFVPNINSAKVFTKWVLPTPVGPTNIKVPMGRLGSLSPSLLRVMARVRRWMARFWAITLLASACCMPLRRIVSSSCMRSTGTPLMSETTLAMSASSTVMRCSFRFDCHSAFKRSTSASA